MEAGSSAQVGNPDLASVVGEQVRQMAVLGEAPQGLGSPERRDPGRSRELPYRFDAYPKWLEASGWKEQSPRHRRTWPLLRRFLQLERWTGARVTFTLEQLADHLCCSRDTARRRLRELEGLEVVSHSPGQGRTVSAITIKHPISTPSSYSETPWEQGGLLGAPDEYLAQLRGPKRHYAELYGAELPEEAAEDETPLTREEIPAALEPDTDDVLDCEADGSAEAIGRIAKEETGYVQVATSEVASCHSLETREQTTTVDSSFPSEEQTMGRKKRKEELKNIERTARRIPLASISEEAKANAQRIVGAFPTQSSLVATRAAQLAQHLRDTDRECLLDVAMPRIQRCAARTNVLHPIRYLIATICQVENEVAVSPEQQRFGNGILERAAQKSPQANRLGQASACRLSSGDFKKGYEWLFGESVSSDMEDEERIAKAREAQQKAAARRRGYEWFFGSSDAEESSDGDDVCRKSFGKAQARQDANEPASPHRDTEREKMVPDDPTKAWLALVSDLCAESTGDVAPEFFDEYAGYSLEGDVLTIAAPDQESLQTLIAHRGDDFGRLWRHRAGDAARIRVGVLAPDE